jgi:hypothetical protein
MVIGVHGLCLLLLLLPCCVGGICMFHIHGVCRWLLLLLLLLRRAQWVNLHGCPIITTSSSSSGSSCGRQPTLPDTTSCWGVS